MLHPALARALASGHIDDLHRAAARWHTIRLAHRAAHEPRVAATSTATQQSASESAAWTSCAPAAGMTPTETAQAAASDKGSYDARARARADTNAGLATVD